MRFLGSCRIKAFYPVQTREEAVIVVQKEVFVFKNGVAGSAVYLSISKDDCLEVAPWVVECEAFFNNLAAISINKGEFGDLYGIPYNQSTTSWELFNEQQRKAILWAGYDGFLLDKTLLAVYANTLKIHAIKAFPKINDPSKSSSYNEIWKKIKKLSNALTKGSQNA